ncbi:recombinase family protein [Paenibacillus sp. MZ04-78.2]|uniref:recombinase family protein n=1 Tax=Paenibacillus sp. MZ04-78.2 TaxID=2962034 RepID=UPI0020B77EB1|nr:recombinase family protein [Paenibacillus sp. MZ04-78.2]MCP3775220.1 recombinase family protein [Paenibacillus sp. MZ04-78.2]
MLRSSIYFLLEEGVNTNLIAIYVRVSSERQTKGYSIDGQLKELRAYAAEHQLSIYREYVDDGYSGKSIDGRPAMLELLADAKQGRFQTVITWKLNRLARNLVDQLKTMEVFKQHNIGCVSLTEQIETNTAQGNLTVQMLGAIAQLEREQIAQNTRLGMQKRSQRGAWNSGNNVLGYEWVTGADVEPHVRIVPHEARLVQMIFEQYRSGQGFKAITNQLNAAGYTTKRNKPFSTTTVRGVLTNINYIGQIQYTAHEKFTGASSDRSKRVVQGTHEPIINMELWSEVRALLNQRSRPPTKQINRHYPLAGLLKCPVCGSSMVPAHTKAVRKDGCVHMNHYYVCGNYTNKGPTACKANTIPASPVENETLSRFQHMLTNKGLLNQIVTRINRRNKEAETPLREQVAQTAMSLKQLEKQQRRCYELFEDGFIGHVELVEKLKSLKQATATLNENKHQLESKLAELENSAVSLKEVRRAMKSLYQSFHAIEAGKRNALIRGFIQSVHVPPDRDVTEMHIQGTAALKHLII